MNIYLQILVSFLYAVACLVTGIGVLQLCQRWYFWQPDSKKLGITSSAFLIGQGLLSSLWMLFGLIGFFKPWLIWIVLACVLISG